MIRHGRRIAGVPRIHLHGHRASLRVGEHAVDDDREAVLPIPVMAELRQGTGPPLIEAAAHVVEHAVPLGEVAGRQLLLDPRLAGGQPVHRRVHLVLRGRLDPELLGERGGVPQPGRRQLGAGVEQPLDEQGEHQVPCPTPLRGEQRLET